jgi:hypothetical protein
VRRASPFAFPEPRRARTEHHSIEDDVADPTPIRRSVTERFQPRRDQIPWRIVAVVGSLVSLCALVFFLFQTRGESAERTRIMRERQRLTNEIAQDYASLKVRIEQWTLSAATSAYPGDVVDPEAKALAWRSQPVVYLRMRVGDALSMDAIHAQARLVALDGLAGCLLRAKGPVGPFAYGELVAHAEMLGSDFLKDVRETRNDLRLRQLAYALDQYKEKQYPVLRDALKYAAFAILVLDEDPPVVPEKSVAFGPDASIEQRIFSVAHPMRLSIRRLSDDRELMRIRRTPESSALQLKGNAVGAAEAIEVRAGQVLGCAMANEALAAVGVTDAPSMENKPSPLPLVAPSASASASAAPSASTPPSASAPATSTGAAGSSSAPLGGVGKGG